MSGCASRLASGAGFAACDVHRQLEKPPAGAHLLVDGAAPSKRKAGGSSITKRWIDSKGIPRCKGTVRSGSSVKDSRRFHTWLSDRLPSLPDLAGEMLGESDRSTWAAPADRSRSGCDRPPSGTGASALVGVLQFGAHEPAALAGGHLDPGVAPRQRGCRRDRRWSAGCATCRPAARGRAWSARCGCRPRSGRACAVNFSSALRVR